MKKILCLNEVAWGYLNELLDKSRPEFGRDFRREALVGEVLFGPRRNAAVVNSTIDELVQNAESFYHEWGPSADQTWEEYEAKALSAPRRLARLCDADESNIKILSHEEGGISP